MRRKHQEYLLNFKGLEVKVISKSMKTMRLTVYPPDGRIRLALPLGVSQDRAIAFLHNKWEWIQQQQTIFLHEADLKKQSEGIFYYFGQCLLKQVIFLDAPPQIYITMNDLIQDNSQFECHSSQTTIFQTNKNTIVGYLYIQVRPNSSIEQQNKLLKNWCRKILHEFLTPLIHKWQDKIGVYPTFYGIKSMKTRWGSCNVTSKRVWLNLELVKLPLSCLEYVVVHELLHLIEPSHNHKFKNLLTHYWPSWPEQKAMLRKPHF